MSDLLEGEEGGSVGANVLLAKRTAERAYIPAASSTSHWTEQSPCHRSHTQRVSTSVWRLHV